jgi:hypothetical protein
MRASLGEKLEPTSRGSFVGRVVRRDDRLGQKQDMDQGDWRRTCALTR